MNAMLGISLWVALVTVVPGLVTVATLYGAVRIAAPDALVLILGGGTTVTTWVWTGVLVTVMVLTQALGILLEEGLVRLGWLGTTFKPHRESGQSKPVSVYDQYRQLYYLLAELRPDDDAQGHLQRTVAQFFLTNNTLVSFITGLLVTVMLAFSAYGVGGSMAVFGYAVFLILCLVVSYRVAVIRFREMAKSIWAARQVRAKAAAE
ncbi:hypothetical protein [Saccharospirillum salsuginis]|uniref:Uncharacterized protein n=1 Tax=Saccharospirillum salsuginis TaxID=418750 RepID=A0A918K163_9GAMM|nr:hypothetical protein [Saccharospirillum salsuginis]GGX40814.1 hypothetical protein GCM10007392_04510 [Saccharospirillum salsuginis]